MKIFCSIITILIGTLLAYGQAPNVLPEFNLKKETSESHLRYLASDHLQGRYTGSEGGEKAAQFIARLFEVYGLENAPGVDGFFQKIPFEKVKPPVGAELKLGEAKFVQGENMLVFRGKKLKLETQAVFAGYGWVDEAGHDDFVNLDVKGKIVFTLPGTPKSQNPFEMFQFGAKKRTFAKARGAVGVVELYRMQFPWQFFTQYFNKERMSLAGENAAEEDIFYAFIKEDKPNPVKELEAGNPLPITLENAGIRSTKIVAPNVVGILEGTDEVLKNEYIVVSAHYDHVGVGKQGGGATTPQDSIFNGARDNGMGTVALLAAAKSLAQNPPKRSIIFLACTGEEMGMIGSKYYVDNPLIPLEQTVFNINNDGGGYNSTEHFTIVGYRRTNVSTELETAATSMNMVISKDPAPEQNLYERSDNISFARKGIPAIDFAPGVTAMDQEIMKYYHQVTDNPETIDYDYLLKFCQAFSHTIRLIADKETALAWTPGDKYERAK